MGLFDKMKDKMSNLTGKHGVRVVVTELEKQDPKNAKFSITDSVVKGRFEVHGEKEVTILSHTIEVYIGIMGENGEDNEEEILIGSETNEGEIIGSDVSWPYVLQPGTPVMDSFCVIECDIPKALEQLEYDDEEEALEDDSLYLFIRIIADVKGTPMDAKVEAELELTPGIYDDDDDDEDNVDEIGLANADAPLKEAGIRQVKYAADGPAYLPRFDAMVAALEAHPGIDVVVYEKNPPATDADFIAAKAIHPVPPALERFYREANGLTLKWHEKGNEDRAGSISLSPLLTVFQDWADIIYFDDDDEHKPLHPVDFFVDEACAALFFDGSENATVYYHYCGEEMATMEIDFHQYLELLLITRGYFYWQTGLSTDISGTCYTTSPSEFRAGMRKLFPSDYNPQFLFRKDYEEEELKVFNARKAEVEKLRTLLEENGVRFQIGDDEIGYINISIENEAQNFMKAEKAFATQGLDFAFSEDWGARSIGSVMVDKADVLH